MRTSMWSLTIILICVFLQACSKGPGENPSPSVSKYNSSGVVKGIDSAAHMVTLDHKDIPGYMSAMEMSFPVVNTTLLTGLAVGDNVAFDLERTGNKVSIVSITKMPGTVAVASGEQLFAANCAECHGAKGEGAKKGIPLISGHALAHSEEEYVQQVVSGKANKMPAFREKFTDDQIAAIVKYVRTVIQAEVKPEQRAHHDH